MRFNLLARARQHNADLARWKEYCDAACHDTSPQTTDVRFPSFTEWSAAQAAEKAKRKLYEDATVPAVEMYIGTMAFTTTKYNDFDPNLAVSPRERRDIDAAVKSYADYRAANPLNPEAAPPDSDSATGP